jgi:ferric-dicitrate binding protein FerR (iron transport regulator)
VKTPPEHIEDLIGSYLAGEASAEESVFLKEWINQHDDNRRYFEQMKTIFRKAAIPVDQVSFDTDRAWENLRMKLPAKSKTVYLPRKWWEGPYLTIAASIILFVAAGIFTYQIFKGDSIRMIQVVSESDTAGDTLPDGSGVFLNKQTKIEYAFDKRKNTHTAKLAGEAYFNIHHNESKIFIVEAEGTFIRDIGTSFNVKAYPDSSTIEVVVEEGEVMFYTEEDQGIYLKANGKGIYDKRTRKFTVADPEPNVTAYRTKFFSFSDHSLEGVVKTLNEVYSTRIDIDEQLKSCRLTVSFNDEAIDEIANVIAETLGLSVSRSGDVITLKGKGCEEVKQ